jgi:uroporphyrin-III C-methyltransferase/precorrin-2 dehydrogenase/sirohydrochlorin ferrochelatase/uroporphyrin-III C-methyltransferase
MAYSRKQGKVILAAAGPGDAELVTVKTARYLQEADVVLTDRLVNKEIIERYCKKPVQVLEVGKQAGKEGSMPQVTINNLMAEYAEKGNLVVRLKGGDVSVFSNVLDELETLTNKGISYEIVPGVTAALGAAAYAGIPLTARGYATGVRLLTFNNPALVTESEWKAWALTTDTLVFYMSAQTLSALAEKLFQAGMPADKPLAIIEQATTPVQQVKISTIAQYLHGKKNTDYISPTLVIIGEVVKLHPRFKWFDGGIGQAEFFAPVEENLSEKIPNAHAAFK